MHRYFWSYVFFLLLVQQYMFYNLELKRLINTIMQNFNINDTYIKIFDFNDYLHFLCDSNSINNALFYL